MSLFSNTLPTYVNQAGEWVENLGEGLTRTIGKTKESLLTPKRPETIQTIKGVHGGIKEGIKKVIGIAKEIITPPEDPAEARKRGLVVTSLTPEGKVKTAVDPLGAVGAMKRVGVVIGKKIVKPLIQKAPSTEAIQPIFKGFKDLTTKFLDYAKGKTTLSKQEITDFAHRPELKKGEADLLNRLGSEVKDTRVPAQEFADSIRRDLLELKPVKVKEPQYEGISIGRAEFHKQRNPNLLPKNYEEVVFESPIVTNGSPLHYPNSKNYFAHARGDEVVEGGKRVWREQEIQSDALQKEGIERMERALLPAVKTEEGKRILEAGQASEMLKNDFKWYGELQKLSPFTNDRFGERIMRERIREKAGKGYEKYRLPTGETIGKIEGFVEEGWTFNNQYPASVGDLKVGKEIFQTSGNMGAISEEDGWIVTDILGDGKFKAVPKGVFQDVEKGLMQNFDRFKETHDLTGKSNPQYRRYSDWGKFLKNKFGGKEVVDPQGNSWMEIDLKKAMGKMPIEAFGLGLFPFTRQKEQEEPLSTDIPEKIGRFIEDRPGSFLDVATRIPEEFKKTVPGRLLRSVGEAISPKTEEEARQRGLVGFPGGPWLDPTAFAGPMKIVRGQIVKVAKSVARGFITSVKKEFPEIKVAGQYIPRSTDRLAIKAKNLIQSDIETAERIARTGTDDDAVAISSELIKHYGNKAIDATDTATRNALYDRAAEIANITARNLTESGRSVQAASILSRLTPEGQLRFAAKEIQRYNEEVEKARGGILGLRKKIPELTGKQADEILTEMRAIQGMAEGEAKAIRFQQLQNRISDLVPSSLYEKVIAVWKAGLLTGLKTSGLNIFSNISHFGLETIKDVPATFVDSVASLFTGTRTTTFTTLGVPKAIREGFGRGWQYLKTGYSERDIGTKLDYRRVHFGKGKVAKGLQTYEETVFRIIGAEDQPFYYGAKARSLYSQAIAQAKNKGLKGLERQKFIDNLVENPTDEMAKYAVLDAETAVFQNPTTLGKIARQIQQAPGGQIVVPFGRTPSAVATQILNYSPIGIAKTIIGNIGKGKFDQRLFAQGIGRGLTGTGILFIGFELGKKEMVSLDRPTSEKEQKLWELEGRKPNSIKIGGEWRSAQVLGPAGNLLLVGAHFQRAFADSGSPTEAMTKALAGGAKSFTEQTFLTGISRTVEAITDPQRSAEGYLGSTLSSAIPTIVSDVARATDPFERRTETIGEKFQARVPVLRQELEPQITVLGKEKERVGSFLEVMADPTRPSPEIQTPISLELRRLWNQGHKVSPTLLGDKEGYKVLTQEQNTDLWKRAGSIIESKLNNLLKKDEYWKLPDDQKGKVIENVVDKSKLFARVEKVLELTEGMKGGILIEKLRELKKDGLMTREVFSEYQRLR